MKHLLITVLFLALVFYNSFSQDTIVCKNGDVISCRIKKEDSTSVYFSLVRNKMKVETFLHKSDIQSLQKATTSWNFDRASFGIGGGLDYGGFGANIVVYPQANIGIFGGVGYALAGIGYNAGLRIRLANEKQRSMIFPYLIGMYGYNSSIYISNAHQYNKLFYGTSFGLGIDIHNKIPATGFWNFAVLIPVRGSEVDNYIDNLKTYHNVEFKNHLWPVAISIGYRFIMGK